MLLFWGVGSSTALVAASRLRPSLLTGAAPRLCFHMLWASPQRSLPVSFTSSRPELWGPRPTPGHALLLLSLSSQHAEKQFLLSHLSRAALAAQPPSRCLILGTLPWGRTQKVTDPSSSSSLEAKMSGSQLEQAISALIDLFHKHSGPDDTIEKEALLQLLKENFPNFLSACVSGVLVPHGDGVPVPRGGGVLA